MKMNQNDDLILNPDELPLSGIQTSIMIMIRLTCKEKERKNYDHEFLHLNINIVVYIKILIFTFTKLIKSMNNTYNPNILSILKNQGFNISRKNTVN